MGLRKHQNTIVGRHQHCGGELRGGDLEGERGWGRPTLLGHSGLLSILNSGRLPFRILYLNTETLFLKCYVPTDKSRL